MDKVKAVESVKTDSDNKNIEEKLVKARAAAVAAVSPETPPA
jgi:hypothetical protein